MELSKTFDCISQDLIIASLHPHGLFQHGNFSKFLLERLETKC